MGGLSVNKRWLYTLLVAAVLLLSALMISCGGRDVPPAIDESSLISVPPVIDVQPVIEPSFQLNGEDYPCTPVMQDFIDRGWKQGDWAEQTGDWSEEEGPTNLVVTGYKLTSGSNDVSAYLDEDACRAGVPPGECRLRSLSFVGKNVDSFCLDGIELAKIDRTSIIELLGSPGKVREEELGVIYHYSMPEKSISEITFAFPITISTVAQIFVVFDIT